MTQLYPFDGKYFFCVSFLILSVCVRSGVTFLSGILMYAITWILLRTDGGDESISASQWKDFMVSNDAETSFSYCCGFRTVFMKEALSRYFCITLKSSMSTKRCIQVNGNPAKIMVEFCYRRLYYCFETIYCRL